MSLKDEQWQNAVREKGVFSDRKQDCHYDKNKCLAHPVQMS